MTIWTTWPAAMLLIVVLVLGAIIVALVASQLRGRKNRPASDPTLLRAGDDDSQTSAEAGNSAINKASWLRPGGW